MKHLSIVAVVEFKDCKDKLVYSDIKQLKEQTDPEKIMTEINQRVQWFLGGGVFTLTEEYRLISVSHSIFVM